MSALKDLIDKKAVKRIATEIARVHPSFAGEKFEGEVMRKLGSLELKERVRLISTVLRAFLPEEFPKAARILTETLSEPVPPDVEGDPDRTGLNGFLVWPLTQYVMEHGLGHHAESMRALYEMTQRFTAEFAIRPFLIHAEAETLAVLWKWARDPSAHVRRLVSEGTRPRLPWAERLPGFQKNPKEGLALLELLKGDPEEYVRRSVANHLNDIAKDHPEIVVKTLRKWTKPPVSRETLWIARHACRTLFKNGHPEALALHGYHPPKVELGAYKLKPARIKMGQAVEFSFSLKSIAEQAQKLMVDYAIHHRKANGKLAPKVFKLKTVNIGAGESLTIEAKHGIRRITTREYYSGVHRVEVLVNGKSLGFREFHLEV